MRWDEKRRWTEIWKRRHGGRRYMKKGGWSKRQWEVPDVGMLTVDEEEDDNDKERGG